MKIVKVLECQHCGSVLYPTGNCSGCGTSTGEAKVVNVECQGDCANCIASIDCDQNPEPQYECGEWLCGQVQGDCSYCPARNFN